jgi:hypothetical protein
VSDAVAQPWPEAPVEGWLDTCATVHMWAQIVGKIRLARAPMLNHWWQATLYLTARGLTTGPIPDGAGAFQIDFDFIDQMLVIAAGDGRTERMPLIARPLPEFYDDIFARLSSLHIGVSIWPVPVEVLVAVPFREDRTHSHYDPEIAERLWRILLVAAMQLEASRKGFLGKSSPVHLFWGSFDLALTRFSGRTAPPHPGGIPNLPDWITREAYSHEVSSCGFWPGTAGGFERPAFYAYSYPSPAGYGEANVRPAEASYSPALREFLLPYDDIRTAADPAQLVQDFLQSTYDAAASLGAWDRATLER